MFIVEAVIGAGIILGGCAAVAFGWLLLGMSGRRRGWIVAILLCAFWFLAWFLGHYLLT